MKVITNFILATLFFFQTAFASPGALPQDDAFPVLNEQTSGESPNKPHCSIPFATESKEPTPFEAHSLDTLLTQMKISNTKLLKTLSNERIVERWSKSESSVTLLNMLNKDRVSLDNGEDTPTRELETKDFMIGYKLTGLKRKTLNIQYFKIRSQGQTLRYGETSDTLNTSFFKLISTLLIWSNQQVHDSPMTDSITIKGWKIVNPRLLEFAKDFEMRRTMNFDTRLSLMISIATVLYNLILAHDFIFKNPVYFVASIIMFTAVIYPVASKIKYDVFTQIDLKKLRQTLPK